MAGRRSMAVAFPRVRAQLEIGHGPHAARALLRLHPLAEREARFFEDGQERTKRPQPIAHVFRSASLRDHDQMPPRPSRADVHQLPQPQICLIQLDQHGDLALEPLQRARLAEDQVARDRGVQPHLVGSEPVEHDDRRLP